MPRIELGPVFACEWRRMARERWSYAMRSVLVAALLAGLAAVCWAVLYRSELSQASALGGARDWCFALVVLTQLSMLLLVAPASIAGGFGTEIARGHVLLMMGAGLTSMEIVCGTLCARLLSVLMSVGCAVPVLVLTSQLIGIPLQAIVRS